MFTWLSTGSALRERLATLEAWVARLAGDVEKRAPTALRAEMDDLRADLDALRASNRKELGKLWRRLRDEPENDSESGDPKLDAILRAQRAGPTTKPQ